MEAGLIAGFNLSIMAIASGALLGIFSGLFYIMLWFIRD